MKKIKVENNIKIAETLPSSFYKSEVIFNELKEMVFYKSWQLIDHESVLPSNANAYPFDFMKDYINEPLLLMDTLPEVSGKKAKEIFKQITAE